MVKALFFDLTDTLQCFDWQKQWKLFSEYLSSELGFQVDVELLKQKYQQVYESYRLGWVSKDAEFFDLLFRQLGWNADREQLKRIERKHLEIRKDFTWLPEDYVKTLEELRKQFKLAVVSSAVADWAYYDFKQVFGFDFKKHFDVVVFSQEQGFLKESGRLFEIALKKLKLKASEAAFVGNDYKADVLTARKAGLKTVFLNLKSEPQGQADLQITSLKQLVEKIPELKSL